MKYYTIYKEGVEIDFICKKFKVSKDLLDYKFKLLDYHGLEWFKQTKHSWKCVHQKQKIISQFNDSDLEYEEFCIAKGLYSFGSLKKWLSNDEVNDLEKNLINEIGESKMETKKVEKLEKKLLEANEKIREQNNRIKELEEEYKVVNAELQITKNEYELVKKLRAQAKTK